MADVRALLRQQRTARRIDHPLAVYSDSGKLSCAVCREPVRPESAWDDHLRSAQHRQKVRAVQALQSNTVNDRPEATAPATANAANGHSDAAPILAHKRRYSETEDDGDVDMGSDGDGGSDGNEDEPSRKKQHRAELPAGVKPTVEKPTIEIKSPVEGREAESGRAHGHEPPRKLSLSTTPQLTPPLARRSSGTPAQGVEMRIPSRPATPIAIKDSFLGGGSGVSNNNNGHTSGSNSGNNSGSNSGGLPSAASTPKTAPLGRSPLIPQEAQMAAQSASGPLNDAVNGSTGTTAARPKTTKATTTTIVEEDEAAPGIAQAAIDEDEWAAFEAEVVNAPAPRPALPTTAAGGTRPDMNGGLVASAPAVSAQDLTAVEGDDDARSKRREAEEAQRMAEKEEATRALEDEFEDMQELESRVQKLKEKREALRSQASQQQLRTTKSTTLAPPVVLSGEATRQLSATMVDKEDIRQQLAATHAKGEPDVDEDGEEEDDEDDEDEDEADWDAFRFRS
ncbi:hypothetical protein SPBR_07154 [Sporothrix brasiliensis 5110]|uniref:Coiled-coil domain-containing protein 16 n=1 Tax=Sporothrix brasiliensis 5110 TaxID=1398154 RepID=A0A0C2FCA9_9PEZI|nr:uncharacterized protein SPBR_07154 [Sporothrix brasiliensis 5110]KIH88753.1 hypothetical protein SPBR_07154 [Sporothrix brasiliensis 5110]